jgi:choloylglycine hydrolase
MCTAIAYKTEDHYFGRNLDVEYSYGEAVTITPRNYSFSFRKMGKIESHFAIIGTAYVCDGYPLYYDATNERGLSIAGLNFPENAKYKPYCEGKDNIAPFELIPWILGQCSTLGEAEELLRRINLLNESFSDKLLLTPLHWMISDKNRSITLEPLKSGIKIYENPVGVLTNNPTFDYHMLNLNNYMGLSRREPKDTFADKDKGNKLNAYSRGMGAIGLPGDYSSASRFVRACFVKMNSVSGAFEEESVGQFFHVLKSVEMPMGCVELENGAYEITAYSSCCNTERGIYYYTTYENSRISAIDMHKEDINGYALIEYPLKRRQSVEYQN